MQYLIEEELANAILAYLSQKPFREVFQLMTGLQGLSPHPEQPATTNEKAAPGRR